MTQPVIPTATPTAPATPSHSAPSAEAVQTPPATAGRTTVHERAAALRAQLGDGGADGPDDASIGGAPDGGESTETPAGIPGQSVVPNSATPNATKSAAAERQQRMAKFREKERAEYAERSQRQQQRQQVTQATTEVDKLRARLSELEPLNDIFKDEATLLAAAENKGLDSKKLIDWMRQRLADPSAAAQRQAKTVEETLRGEIEKLRGELGQTKEEIAATERKRREQTEAHQRAVSFIDHTTKSAQTHPLAARFLKRHGQEGLIAFANQFIAPLMGESYTLPDLHDHLEQLLDEIQLHGQEPSKNDPGVSHPAKKPGSAEQTVTTLGNQLTTERETVTQEVPWASLPLKERSRLLKEQLSRGE